MCSNSAVLDIWSPKNLQENGVINVIYYIHLVVNQCCYKCFDIVDSFIRCVFSSSD